MMDPTCWTIQERTSFVESLRAAQAELRDCLDLCREQAETIARLKAQSVEDHPHKHIWDALDALQRRVDVLEGR